MFFFFFQAEDGIRDLYVTGVQTCALPISCGGPRSARSRPRRGAATPRGAGCDRAGPGGGAGPDRRRGAPRSGRSEERRVGKSVDLGGRRIIKKKKKR